MLGLQTYENYGEEAIQGKIDRITIVWLAQLVITDHFRAFLELIWSMMAYSMWIVVVENKNSVAQMHFWNLLPNFGEYFINFNRL